MVSTSSPPLLYKGLALFTPGGDLVYYIDPDKQGRWHLQLCIALQELLGLPEPPLFLTPCYTATVDRWRHPQSQHLQVSAEAYPRVWQYRLLLSQIFDTAGQPWRLVSAPADACDPLVMQSYRHRFPQLWQPHQLIVQLDALAPSRSTLQGNVVSRTVDGIAADKARPDDHQSPPQDLVPVQPQGYVLRLFVAGAKRNTTQILETLHQLLDHALNCPYTLNVIDVLKRPDLAEADQVAATPTLLKVWPPPTRKLVGAVDHTEKVLQLLGVA